MSNSETINNIQLRIDASYQQIINIEKHIAELEEELQKERRKSPDEKRW